MDKKKSLINVAVSICFKLILIVLTILTKRYLIKYVGNEANGLLSLYTSIIGFLAIAELGVGTAITFSMYKPIVDNDTIKVASLYRLFIKFYRIVGIIILIGGLIIAPFLPFLAKDNQGVNLYFTFILMLISVVIGYMYSAKTSVINAYKNNYITTSIYSISIIFEGVLQILLLYFFKSFELFLLGKIISQGLQFILTNLYFNKHHKVLKKYKEKLDDKTKEEVTKKTKAMFMHKIGGLLVNTCDSIIISSFIGVVILGKYSNYTTIVLSMNGVLLLFFTPLTSIIGHLCAKEDLSVQKKYFNFFYGLNFVLGAIFYLGYYAVIDDVIRICFVSNVNSSTELLMPKNVSFVIALNYFLQFMRNSTLTFRDATGTFYNDRYKPIFEGLLNLVLSLILVQYTGIVGVILATIITNILICHVVEPFVLFKYGFATKPTNYYIINYSFIAIFIFSLITINYMHYDISNVWMSFLVNGFIAVAFALIPCSLMFLINKDFRQEMVFILKLIGNKIKKNKLTE